MTQITDAIVLGFTKAAALPALSFAPLRQLRQEGHLRAIHYVTWDSPDLDGFVRPILEMPDVQVTRVPPPRVKGTPPQKTLLYQTHNLDAALSLIAEDDAIVLKLRPDFVANVDFLRDKIVNFERHCGTVPRHAYGIEMPKPILGKKVWVPWADSNQFFFYEDAALLGQKSDLAKLRALITRADLETLEMLLCEHYYHIARYARVFLPSYPLFRGYLKNFQYLTNYPQYRMEMIGHALNGAFFLFPLIAHAWILHSQFHVDCGAQDTLRFYPNLQNMTTDWSDPMQWRLALPYDRIAYWRGNEKPGLLFPNVKRVFGRLVSDDWQKAIFTQETPELPDIPRKTLLGLLEHIAGHGDGRLKPIEHEFYRDLQRFYRNYMSAHARELPTASAWPHAAAKAQAAAAVAAR
ncbi:MAG TPA: hypothetical protein VGG36_06685 [Rhizomicrobium sp.]